ncbi:hypothetical protein NEDG_01029 [Nematocida displodere]|uniref:Uncharacterized protein n=1 Tax=Nematocida displodere TaxID=1805483 RepID=A0A177EBX3_9MICR|nr:hypothetical protein NEDG_01029 [Nematocida displodere]
MRLSICSEEEDEREIMKRESRERDALRMMEKLREKRDQTIFDCTEATTRMFQDHQDLLAFFLGYLRASVLLGTTDNDYSAEEDVWMVLAQTIASLLGDQAKSNSHLGIVRDQVISVMNEVVSLKCTDPDTIKEKFRQLDTDHCSGRNNCNAGHGSL